MSNYHIPILTPEILDLLKPAKGKTIIDATIGGGGHTKAIIEKGARVVGIDQDPEAITYTGNRMDIDQSKLTLIEGNFGNFLFTIVTFSLNLYVLQVRSDPPKSIILSSSCTFNIPIN